MPPPASIDELLTPVDVVGRAGERGVRHQVDGQRRHVLRPDHAPDRQRRAQLVAAGVEPVAEQLADSGVSTKPAAIRLTRTGAISSARLAVSAGRAAVIAGSTEPRARYVARRCRP